jgi:hypothetical protein
MITSVAGNGGVKRAGDGSPATSTGITALSDVTLDSPGNLYYTETGTVRKVSWLVAERPMPPPV